MLKKTDDQLKREVKLELAWDTRLTPADIDVKATDGIVKLFGTVTNYAQKVAAQDAAHRVAGVLDVINEITVKIPRVHADEEIAKEVRTALQWDVLVPDEKIKSTVTDGWVKLEGTVNSLRQSQDSAKAVERLPGVIGVTNKLEVEPKSFINPDDLREAIEDALERRAEREAERLRIEVRNGEVDLFGRVHSWQEKNAVVGAVNYAAGVKKVNDHLRIDPYF